jgi:hypothetical protein
MLSTQHRTIESVLARGEKLDTLVDRSNALSAQSKMFYKTAKKVGPFFHVVFAVLTELKSKTLAALSCEPSPLSGRKYSRHQYDIIIGRNLSSWIVNKGLVW